MRSETRTTSSPGPWATQPSVTFSQFVVKLHSRCDLACPDCYVYALRDTGWTTQPRAMPYRTRELTARRIAEHVRAHRPPRARVMLHGGEPLLAGRRRLGHFAEALRREWRDVDTPLDLVVQTNGAQLDRSWLELFRRHGVRVGVSLDGTREAHDRRRRRPSGRGTYDDVVRALDLLREHPDLYAGLLCTVDLGADPVDTYEALIERQPPALDLLLPLGTRQHPPPGLPSDTVPYARWLAAVFDRWFDAPVREVPVRMFDSLVDLLLGGATGTELWGVGGSDVVVVQPDGSVEQNDILKAVHEGAAYTGFHVARHSFDEAAAHPGFAAERAGLAGLCGACRECPVVRICGGGLRAHRHRAGNGYDNPSCYCADLRAFIAHVSERVNDSLLALVKGCHNPVTEQGNPSTMGMPAGVDPLH
ncbi:FxsB family radical SAM/SPASM domain protein [Streptomyces roseirectus]|uniref:FxsB family radical SAM/SPASM domain protein n=1 Tax=Streptomyces roseirectus TaxID=2768066 RepID=A0A7H0IKT3_9ACTN|nr:FxsB family cyclophane-forming radical SAM/SPASM peptide maturase [Streptomyces roseirectus]QNP73399.1 FxsB family radical SAM/SPASM domain protein [Streptomyces roseirectus]